MRYASLCDGIGAVHVAWQLLGWTCAFTSEIEAFPAAVVEHHFPGIPNLGDMTQIDGSKHRGDIDLLVAGTPCQSFSVAGLRKGMDDARGNLALVYLRLVDSIRPRWVVWENVPGVLSSNGGRDFGSLLGALGQLGYGWAYRILDARDYGLPCSRRRVIVVGHSGGRWQCSTAALFAEGEIGWSCAESGHRRPQVCTHSLTTDGQRAGCGETFVASRRGLRTFTTGEREMLMGFTRGYTDVPGGTETKRIRAIGNSMAVPVMTWIGERIDMVDSEQEPRP